MRDYGRVVMRSSTLSASTVAWPSGLGRWFKAPVSSEAWVGIPPHLNRFFIEFCKQRLLKLIAFFVHIWKVFSHVILFKIFPVPYT